MLCGLVGLPFWAWSTVFFLKQHAESLFIAALGKNEYLGESKYAPVALSLLAYSLEKTRLSFAWRFCDSVGLSRQSLSMYWRCIGMLKVVMRFMGDKSALLVSCFSTYVKRSIIMGGDFDHFRYSDSATHFYFIADFLLKYPQLIQLWLFSIDSVEEGNERVCKGSSESKLVRLFVGLLCGEMHFSSEQWKRLLSFYFEKSINIRDTQFSNCRFFEESIGDTEFFDRSFDVAGRMKRMFNMPVCLAALSRGKEYYDVLLDYKQYFSDKEVSMGEDFFPIIGDGADTTQSDTPLHDYTQFPVFLHKFLQVLSQKSLSNNNIENIYENIAEEFEAGTAFFWKSTSAAFRVALLSSLPAEGGVPGALTTLVQALSAKRTKFIVTVGHLFHQLTSEQKRQVFLANLGVLSMLLEQIQAQKCSDEGRVSVLMQHMMFKEQCNDVDNADRVTFFGGQDGILVQLARHEKVFNIDGQIDSPLMRVFSSGVINIPLYSSEKQCALVTPEFVNTLLGVVAEAPSPSLILNQTQWVDLLTCLFIKYPSEFDETESDSQAGRVTWMKHQYHDDCLASLFQNNVPLKQALKKPGYQAVRAALIEVELLKEEDLSDNANSIGARLSLSPEEGGRSPISDETTSEEEENNDIHLGNRNSM